MFVSPSTYTGILGIFRLHVIGVQVPIKVKVFEIEEATQGLNQDELSPKGVLGGAIGLNFWDYLTETTYEVM